MTSTAETPGSTQWHEISKRHHDRMAMLKETLERQGYLLAVSQRDPGYSILLSRNLSGQGWRVTSFRSRDPIGHREYEALDGRAPAFNALQEFASTDWKLIERAPTLTSPGETPLALPGDLDRALGVRSYGALSHSPEQRADTDIRWYVEAVTALHQKLTQLAKTPEQQALIPAEIGRYKENYRQHQHAIWGAQTRAASAFIVGPSNFPVVRNAKRLDTVDRRRAEFIAWKNKAESAATRAILDARSGEQITSDQWRELQRHLARDIGIIKRIDAGVEPYDRSAFVTSIAGRIERLAANGESELVEKALQYIRAQQADMAKPIFTERHKVWQLAAVSESVNTSRRTGIEQIAKAAGVEILANHDADRIQILFEQIPEASTREAMKRQGWKWSPSNQAWQRKATDAAVYSAKQILGLT
jgi:hypothetical protein